jgi:hydroxymethylbilane synthase
VRIATRPSPLALWQAEHVAGLLKQAGLEETVEIVKVVTSGDRDLTSPVGLGSSVGVFVKEVQAALLDNRADLAVHSLKDLPTQEPPGLVLACFPERADPRDALVGKYLAELSPGAPVATGSLRRRAQLAWLRPDLVFKALRGNIGTRLEKIPPGGGIVMAAAALERLGIAQVALEKLSPAILMPEPGQGALVIEARAGDTRALEAAQLIDHPPTRQEVAAEREFLAGLQQALGFRVGCSLPVGALASYRPPGVGHAQDATMGAPRDRQAANTSGVAGRSKEEDSGMVNLQAVLVRPDGHAKILVSSEGVDPTELGRRLAFEVIEERGGRELLASILPRKEGLLQGSAALGGRR